MPKQLYFTSTEWVPHQGIIKLDPAVEKAQKQFFDAFEAVKIKPDIGATLAWDPAMIVVDALRHLDPDPSAAQVRDYIARLKGFAGINGLYDFPKHTTAWTGHKRCHRDAVEPDSSNLGSRERTDGNPARQINRVPRPDVAEGE